MSLNNIDYLAYQYVFDCEKGFIDYLRTENGGGLVKKYSINMNYAWELVEKISQKYDFKLVKSQSKGVFQCIIGEMVDNTELGIKEYKKGYAESEMPSMAICLAIIDLFDTKDLYIDEAKHIINEINKQREINIKRLTNIWHKILNGG